MTTSLPDSLTAAPDRSLELRAWVVGIRDLRRDGIDLAVRGRPGVPGIRSGERCVAVATGPSRWLLGLVDARGPGDEPAALARSVAGVLRRRAPGLELPALLQETDAFVRSETRGSLVAATLVDVDTARHTVRIAVAGGVAPLVAGRSGDVVPLGERGPFLGLTADARWRVTGPIRLAPGHVLLLTTDGVPDRVRDDGTTFGAERVAGVLRRERASPRPRQVVRAVLDAASAWSADDPSDLSALALRLA